ncbi:dynein regulatory complex protein 11 isoform X2 [Musca autumnalis]
MRTLNMLKCELCNIELNEYIYMDKVLIARKLSPYDICIWRSPDFLYRRPLAYQNFIYKNGICIDDYGDERQSQEERAYIAECVTIIQAHERARRSRVLKSAIMYDKKKLMVKQANKIPYIFTYQQGQSCSIPIKRTTFNACLVKNKTSCRDILKAKTHKIVNLINVKECLKYDESREMAALRIQSAWRIYKAKKIAEKNILLQRHLYGMTGRRLNSPNKRRQSIHEIYKEDLIKQNQNSKFEQLITNERTRLLKETAPNIMEDISDHIRAWFKEFYEKTGDFHPYPEVAKKGTVLVLLDETMNFEEFKEFQSLQNMSKEEKKAKAEKEKMKRLLEKEKYKKQKLKDAKRRKKLKDAGIYDIAYQLTSSKDIEKIDATIKQFSIEWRNVDEYLNKNHEAISKWVTENELSKIHRELRILVDNYMRLEYELLKKAWSLDNKTKYKPMKERKLKFTTERKKRNVLNPTEQRTIDSLYQELKESGIIEQPIDKSFSDFVGDFNFIADDTRDENNMVMIGPEYADMKAIIQECLVGYGNFMVDKPKSICIIGPANSGKQLLCRIISSELDAVLFNLSPEKTYQFAHNVNYFIQTVMKVAKELQPSILFIDDAHRVFWKKVPKDQIETNPTLHQNVITKKILKVIKKDDKIMLLGTSDAPWNAKPKFKNVFQKILLVPKSGYATTYLLWMDKISKIISEDAYDDYTITALAKVLCSYNTGEIVKNVEHTLNLKRRMGIKRNHLNPMEFIDYFMQRPEPLFPLQDKIIQKFEKWYNRTNPYRKLKAAMVLKNQNTHFPLMIFNVAEECVLFHNVHGCSLYFIFKSDLFVFLY